MLARCRCSGTPGQTRRDSEREMTRNDVLGRDHDPHYHDTTAASSTAPQRPDCSHPEVPSNAGCARHCPRVNVNDDDLRLLVPRKPWSVRRLRPVHWPPTCRAMSNETPPQPPRRCWRSSLPSLRTSSLRTATTSSDTRRRSARVVVATAPGRACETANASPGVGRSSTPCGGSGSAARMSSASFTSTSGTTAHVVPETSLSTARTVSGRCPRA